MGVYWEEEAPTDCTDLDTAGNLCAQTFGDVLCFGWQCVGMTSGQSLIRRRE